jgi:hypothetical protein
MRKLTVLLALACAGTQIAAGSALLMSTLALGFHASDHRHSVSLVADEGHLHLVLSHDERGGQDPGGAWHHGDPTTSVSKGDHVVHLEDNDGVNTIRRADLAVPAAAPAVAMLPALSPRSVPHRSPEPRARSSDLLRTVVLRL